MATQPATGTGSRLAHLGGQVRNVIVAAWAAVTGIAPHVLHHVGPLAGTALVAGAGGRVLFGVVGLVATIPMLRRLHRRFGTWIAPAIALAVFGVVFSLSTFVIGPRISGATDPAPQTEPAGHDDHGHGGTDTSPQGR